MIKVQQEIVKSTVIVVRLNIPLSVIDRSSQQKISKDIIELNSTINQLGLIDIHRIFYFITVEYCEPQETRGYLLSTYSPCPLPVSQKMYLLENNREDDNLHRHDYFETILLHSVFMQLVY